MSTKARKYHRHAHWQLFPRTVLTVKVHLLDLRRASLWLVPFYIHISGRSRILKRGVQFQFHAAMPKVVHRGVYIALIHLHKALKKKIRLHFSLQDELSWHIYALQC